MGAGMKQPETDYEALLLALSLSVSTDDYNKGLEALKIAESIAERLPEHEVTKAMAAIDKGIDALWLKDIGE